VARAAVKSPYTVARWASDQQLVDKVPTPRRDAPAIRADRNCPNQPHGPRHSPAPNRAGRRLRQNPHAEPTTGHLSRWWHGGAASLSVEPPRYDEKLPQSAQTEILRINPMDRDTAPRSSGPVDGSIKIPMQGLPPGTCPGGRTVAPPAGSVPLPLSPRRDIPDCPAPTARPNTARPLAHRRQPTHDSPRRDTPCSTNSESITPCRAACRTC